MIAIGLPSTLKKPCAIATEFSSCVQVMSAGALLPP
jgi:hypothetical protein